MAWKTSSIFSMTRGLRWSNLWMASRTNSSTSAAAASLLSLRNSISCEQCSGSVKTATFTSLVHSVGHPVFWCSLQTRGTAHHGDDVGCHVGEAHAAWVESAHQQLPVLISVFVFCDVVRLDHLLFQNDHQLRGGERKKTTTCVRFTALLLFSRQKVSVPTDLLHIARWNEVQRQLQSLLSDFKVRSAENTQDVHHKVLDKEKTSQEGRSNAGAVNWNNIIAFC